VEGRGNKTSTKHTHANDACRLKHVRCMGQRTLCMACWKRKNSSLVGNIPSLESETPGLKKIIASCSVLVIRVPLYKFMIPALSVQH
jgi:hypothetical protein